MLLQAFLVLSMYSSKLASSFTAPHYFGDIKTVEDFAQSDLEWGGTESSNAIPLANATKGSLMIILSIFKEYSLEEMKQRVNRRDHFAIFAVRLTDHSFGMEEYVNKQNIIGYKPIKENVFTWYNAAFLRRNSVLTESISLFIMYTFDCGLLEIWDKQAFYPYIGKPLYRYLSSMNKQTKYPKKLSLVHFSSIFFMWIIGVVISSVIFTIEVISRTKNS